MEKILESLMTERIGYNRVERESLAESNVPLSCVKLLQHGTTHVASLFKDLFKPCDQIDEVIQWLKDARTPRCEPKSTVTQLTEWPPAEKEELELLWFDLVKDMKEVIGEGYKHLVKFEGHPNARLGVCLHAPSFSIEIPKFGTIIDTTNASMKFLSDMLEQTTMVDVFVMDL